jgi:hypothetical protein
MRLWPKRTSSRLAAWVAVSRWMSLKLAAWDARSRKMLASSPISPAPIRSVLQQTRPNCRQTRMTPTLPQPQRPLTPVELLLYLPLQLHRYSHLQFRSSNNYRPALKLLHRCHGPFIVFLQLRRLLLLQCPQRRHQQASPTSNANVLPCIRPQRVLHTKGSLLSTAKSRSDSSSSSNSSNSNSSSNSSRMEHVTLKTFLRRMFDPLTF